MRKENAPLKGILLMVVSAAFLVTHDSISKHLAETYPLGQIISLRHVSSLVVIVLYAYFVSGWSSLAMVDRAGQLMRATIFVGSTFLIILSVSLLPLSTATAIIFSSPIFVVAFAGPVLGERIGFRRWSAVIVGFFGVLIIVRPGAVDFNWYLLVPLLSAAVSGLRDNFTRRLAGTDHPISILFWSTLLVVIVATTTGIFGWQPVTYTAAAWLILLGILNTVAHFMMIESLRVADASLVTPFRFTGIVWAALLGIVIWGQYPDRWTILGGIIIICAGIYIVERGERRNIGR